MNKTKILVADDDRSICTLIKLILEKEGFEVSCLFDGESVVNEIAAGGKYDLIILDIMMPEMLGTNAAKKIKDICDTPIIFITAPSSDEDKIEAYDSGADDYLCKPFSSVELVLRVKAVLKRTKTEYKEEIEFLHSEKSVVIQGNKIILTDTELRLLEFLYNNKGSVMSIKDIYEAVWEEKYLPNSNNTVMVFMLGLRKKIEEDYANPKHIITIWGKGYKYV
ncbi:MAG: response regulator transcription factor [Eubacteriales bacterium]|nr:response regulator transcription factor [Eubacteriales bacterium]